MDKDQLGGVFWEIKSDVICKQPPGIHPFVLVSNTTSIGEGEGC